MQYCYTSHVILYLAASTQGHIEDIYLFVQKILSQTIPPA